jgi:hypothetical protein
MELNGRKVVDVEIDGVDPTDYPDFCDAYFSMAIYEDTGEELDDADLELLSEEYADVLNEMAYEHFI